MIVRISLFIGIILFTAYGLSEPATIKIKPSEIFEGFPQITPASTPKFLQESESPSSDTRITPPDRDILSSQDKPVQSDQPSSPLQESKHFYLDNKALEDFIKSHSSPYVQTAQPPPIPDIEKLREKLLSTPSPTPISDIIPFTISVNVEKMNDKWNQLEGDLVIDYQLKNLHSSLSLKGKETNGEFVTVLKNTPSREALPLKKGRYHITGIFWLPNAPDLEIKSDMGTLIVDNRMRYTITLDKNMEQDIMREIGLKNAEKLKALEEQSKDMINQEEE